MTEGNGKPPAEGFAFWSAPPPENPLFAGMSQEQKLRIVAAHGGQASAMLMRQKETLKAQNPGIPVEKFGFFTL